MYNISEINAKQEEGINCKYQKMIIIAGVMDKMVEIVFGRLRVKMEDMNRMKGEENQFCSSRIIMGVLSKPPWTKGDRGSTSGQEAVTMGVR